MSTTTSEAITAMHTETVTHAAAPRPRSGRVGRKPFLSVSEAARRAHVATETMRAWCERGAIDAKFVVSRWRIDPASLDRVLAGSKNGRRSSA